MPRRRKSSARSCNGWARPRASWSFPAKDTAQASATIAAPPAGSIQEAALANPLVQRARKSSRPKSAACSICATSRLSQSTHAKRGNQTMINPLKISEMLSQANQMQEEVQRKLGQTVVEAASGGGAVTATMNGKKAAAQAAHRPRGGGWPERRPARRGDARGPGRGRRQRSRPQGREVIQSSVQGMLGGLKHCPGSGLSTGAAERSFCQRNCSWRQQIVTLCRAHGPAH